MKNNTDSKFIKYCISLIIIAWGFLVIIDYYMTKHDKDPLFCVSNVVIEEEDGYVTVCKGLGYKYYLYKKDSYSLKKFVPFWIKDSGEDQYENND